MRTLPAAFVLALFGCGASDSKTYTLYRNSMADDGMRIHVATFDAASGESTESYNRQNCELAASLFQNQDGVKTRFWCEKRRYRK